MIAILSLIFSFSVSASELPPPDCTYTGTGTVYRLDRPGKKFIVVPEKGYRLESERYALGAGKYLLKTLKTFSDGRPPLTTSAWYNAFVGPYDGSSDDGKVVAFGYCSRVGHCFGDIKFTEVNYWGKFQTDYDSSSVRLLMTDLSNGWMTEEISYLSGNWLSCEFLP
ncbi:MAG: hypothetical protein AB7K68_08625 [Bacteriovoracia bacterium]